MDNNIQIFKNDLFGQVRTILINDEPWFVGKDVAISLSYVNPQKAIRDHVDEDDKTVNELFTVNGTKGILINESGLYSLTLSSKLPDAKKFKHWITHEVIPSIRKTGGYSFNVPKTFAEALRLAADQQEQIEQQQLLLEEQKPKVLFADAIVGSKNSCLVGELAKILTNNGVVIGQNRLFKWLRKHHFLGTVGERYNIPNQEYVEQGLFELKKTVHDENGVMVSKVTTKVTTKGQQYFINKFLNGEFKVESDNKK